MKTLRTFEMLQQLGLEDTATNQDGYRVGYDAKGNLLMWSSSEEKPQNSEDHMFQIYYPFLHGDQWTINHVLISFDEAIEAYTKRKQGVAYVYSDHQEFIFNPSEISLFTAIAEHGISLDDLLIGKWRILSKEEA